MMAMKKKIKMGKTIHKKEKQEEGNESDNEDEDAVTMAMKDVISI